MAQQPTIVRGLRRVSGVALGLALVGAGSVAFAGAAQADPNPNVTLCHATSSAKNPFRVITIDAAAVTKRGHGKHENDVIPPFTYTADNNGREVTFDGLNWDDNWKTNGEGTALEEVTKAMCAGGSTPSPSPTPSTSSTPTPSTSSTPTPSTSATPSVPVTPSTTPTPKPSTPVVETDGLAPSGPHLGLLAAGAALLLGGAATALASRRSTHS